MDHNGSDIHRRGMTPDVVGRYSVIGSGLLLFSAATAYAVWSAVNGHRSHNAAAFWFGIVFSLVSLFMPAFCCWGLWRVWRYSREIVHDE
jgi:hypothetical protein